VAVVQIANQERLPQANRRNGQDTDANHLEQVVVSLGEIHCRLRGMGHAAMMKRLYCLPGRNKSCYI
jgi:hypothetical protein